MIKIEYPAHPFRVRAEHGKEFIFDELRKSWVRLSPEEWVRQHFLQYLVQVKKYPAPLIAVEKEIYLGELRKRFDILVYSSSHQPWMMVECKSMDVPLSEAVLHQVLRYNIATPVTYLIITNGSYVLGLERNIGGVNLLQEIPDFGF